MREALAEAVAQLEFAALFGGPGTIAEAEGVRIDIQGPWNAGPGLNIQAQTGRATISAIRIANTLGAAEGEENQDAVVEAVRAALIAAAQDGEWRDVTGTSP
jgi:hypothetical protein